MSTSLSGRIDVRTEIPFDYVLREVEGASRELILLLHGYSESGKRIFGKLESVLPRDAVILAPNAPFAFAERRDGEYRMAHSWYFYNPKTDEYVIDMAPSVSFLMNAIEKMGYGNLPLRIIGFSQGGYLAPILGEKLPQTKQVIGLHSEFLCDELGPRLAFRTDNIVGAEDEIVPPDPCERSFRVIAGRSLGGEFFKLPVAHRIDEQVARKVSELVRLP
jgi:predicted esterase